MPVSRSIMQATLTIALLSLCLVFLPLNTAAEEQVSQIRDMVGPTIEHTPISKTAAATGIKEIRATVTDNVAVREVRLFYRVLGSSDRFVSINMRRELDSNVYVAKLAEITSPGIEYYIEASDSAGNTKPRGTKSMPFKVAIGPGQERATVPAILLPAEGKSISKWVWIGLGAVAVGALAGGGDGGGEATATVNITAPVP